MRAPLFDKGSMILADGLILATDGKKTLYLIEPSPEGFKHYLESSFSQVMRNNFIKKFRLVEVFLENTD